ncbi:DoxX family protein [Nocardia sp. CA-135953]|uniref:DoxX family protein n=1 Tax=Nocardia sp. CA-135953 TaxID=3239978 RepID=UPI003D98DF1D
MGPRQDHRRRPRTTPRPRLHRLAPRIRPRPNPFAATPTIRSGSPRFAPSSHFTAGSGHSGGREGTCRNACGRSGYVTGLYWFLGFEFFVGFATEFWPGVYVFGPAYSEKFAKWGFHQSMRFVVGGLELLAAVLLVLPRRESRFLGAAMLVLTGAVTTHLIDDSPFWQGTSAPIHLVIMMVVALANWQAGWRDVVPPWGSSALAARGPEALKGR